MILTWVRVKTLYGHQARVWDGLFVDDLLVSVSEVSCLYFIVGSSLVFLGSYMSCMEVS
jgi:hypothetical protein